MKNRAQACWKAGPFVVAAFALVAVALPVPTAAADTIRGTLSVVWGDPAPFGAGAPRRTLFVDTGRGETWKLWIDEDRLRDAGGILTLNRQRVIVDGRYDDRRDLFMVERITLEDPDRRPLRERYRVEGSQPYVWILCRFADDPSTPETPAWFEGQALGPYPSLDDFWREVSFDQVDILGSEVYGWYDLPEPRSYYVHDIDPNDPGDEAELTQLALDATELADPDVYFPDFVGINIIFNGTLDGWAWGGGGTLDLDGHERRWGITWMPDPGWDHQCVLAHEMGHSFGLPHSSGPYGYVYDSAWDIMSNSGGTCFLIHPVYGCPGQHTIGPYKDMLDWIDPSRRYELTYSSPFVQTLTLYDLAVTPPGGEFHLLRAPWTTDPTQFYTIERRRMTGYDQSLPGEGAVMHEVDPARGSDALVIDIDGDGDCNDEGAIWRPGEAFVDVANSFVVVFDWEDDYRTVITFSNTPRNPVYVDRGATGYQDGSPTDPWDTVYEGHGSVIPTGDVWIDPGSYDEALLLSKPCTLRVWGTGTVIIGQ